MSNITQGEFNQQIEALIGQAVNLYQRSCLMPSQPTLLAEAIEELRVTLEELQVAEEELIHQNEELVAARQAVDAERQRYQDLFEFAPDGYLVTDAEGTIQEANRAAAKLLNLPQKRLVGKPLISYVPMTERRDFRSRLLQLTKGSSTQGWDIQLQPRHEPYEGQQTLDIDLSVTVVQDLNNEPVALRWLLRNVTKRKQAEKQVHILNAELEQRVAERTAELEEANRVKDEFLAVVSHELRSPLNSILGWARLLRTRKFDPATTARALETIERNAKLQAHLIEDLLDISRIVQGKLRLSLRPVPLLPILEAVIDAVRPEAEVKNIHTRFEIGNGYKDAEYGRVGDLPQQGHGDTRNQNSSPYPPISLASPHLDLGPREAPFGTSSRLKLQGKSPSYPLQILADSSRIQQIFWNLLSNAIKFTPQGGQIEVWLEQVEEDTGARSTGESPTSPNRDTGNSQNSPSPGRSPSPHPAYAQITVSDTGQGISPEFLPYMFDHFRQASSKTTRLHSGLGLGLGIVRKLVELHGGVIDAISPGEGQGATFIVKLPLEIPTKPSVSIPGSEADVSTGIDTLVLRGLRVVVVDDEADIRDFLVTMLTQSGATVTAVESVEAAIEAVTHVSPDVLISDIGMPIEDGYALIRKVRILEANERQTPAIALTAYAGVKDCTAALSAGFQSHLPKPVEPDKLIQAIAQLTGRSN